MINEYCLDETRENDYFTALIGQNYVDLLKEDVKTREQSDKDDDSTRPSSPSRDDHHLSSINHPLHGLPSVDETNDSK